ncbi:MAG: ABC transporter ATP-binding protein [Flavobacteriaceae bacterium]|nr:ABC transporter ATP-binding protein [Flavobacteriaceae bacterium]
MSHILDIKNLSKSYDGKNYALSECTFALDTGKICAVVGESGSGKSTLIRLIAGLERPNGGSITIKGAVMSDDNKITAPQNRHVGLVFQDYALFPHLPVAQNIGFGIKAHKDETLQQMLKLIKMDTYASAYPSELSGGQEQRVALARALALNPELLLLDEPFSNLDAALKSDLRQEIKQIVNQVGTSMIFITHDLYDAIDIADEILFLKKGKIQLHCPLSALSKSTENQAVKSLIDELKHNAEHLLQLLKH